MLITEIEGGIPMFSIYDGNTKICSPDKISLEFLPLTSIEPIESSIPAQYSVITTCDNHRYSWFSDKRVIACTECDSEMPESETLEIIENSKYTGMYIDDYLEMRNNRT